MQRRVPGQISVPRSPYPKECNDGGLVARGIRPLFSISSRQMAERTQSRPHAVPFAATLQRNRVWLVNRVRHVCIDDRWLSR